MSSNFVSIAREVFKQFNDVPDLLPLRLVERDVKQAADNRIFQVILNAIVATPDRPEVEGGMGVLRVICDVPSDANEHSWMSKESTSYSLDGSDQENDAPSGWSWSGNAGSNPSVEGHRERPVEVKTYGEIRYEIANSRWSMETASAYLQGSESSDAEFNVVATEVCVEQPSPGMRFLPPKGLERKLSTSTNKLRLAYCASATDIPNMDAKILDDILIALDNDEEKGIAMAISERGSYVYYQVQRMNAPSSHPVRGVSLRPYLQGV